MQIEVRTQQHNDTGFSSGYPKARAGDGAGFFFMGRGEGWRYPPDLENSDLAGFFSADCWCVFGQGEPAAAELEGE